MDFAYLSDLNYLAILVSAVAYWVIGALWYSPVLFGKIWGNIVQPSEEAKKKMGRNMVLSFIGFFVICFIMAIVLNRLGEYSHELTFSIKLALAAAVGFMAVPMWINQLYQNSSFNVLVIDVLYHLVGFVVAAIILTSWT